MNGPACACLNVEYKPIDNGNGTMSERWQCVLCKTPFYRNPNNSETRDPVAVLLEEFNKLKIGELVFRCLTPDMVWAIERLDPSLMRRLSHCAGDIVDLARSYKQRAGHLQTIVGATGLTTEKEHLG